MWCVINLTDPWSLPTERKGQQIRHRVQRVKQQTVKFSIRVHIILTEMIFSKMAIFRKIFMKFF